MANADMKEPAPRSLQSPNSSQEPIAIFWDIENCRVPNDVNHEDVARNIIATLRLVTNGEIKKFCAYGDTTVFSKGLREACSRTGIEFVDVPNGRKNAADMAIVTSMLDFTRDNRPPLFIMFISGDVDFALPLNKLGQRGYTVILAIPSGVVVSPFLRNAGKFVLDWPLVAQGGYVMPGLADVQHVVATPPHPPSYSLSDVNEAVTLPPSPASCGSSSAGANAASAENNFPCGLDSVWPGNINDLKVQIVKLLQSSDGSLPLTSVSANYKQAYGRDLCVADYGGAKLVDLLNKMSGDILIEGGGRQKRVRLPRAVPNAPHRQYSRMIIKEKEH